MANIKLQDNNWEASGIYDIVQQKTQRQINAEVDSAKASVIIDAASGAIASFPDGADGMPLKSLTVNIEPVQSGSGDPSPTNIRPISGWTGCNIVHGGIGDISFEPNKAIDGSGNIVDSTGGGYSELISASPADDAVVINNISAGQKRIRVHAYDASGAWIRQVATINLLAGDPAGFYKIPISLADTDKLLRISTGNLTETKLVTVGHQIPITFPTEAGTVYGGTLTINDDGTGVLASDYAIYPLSDFSWSKTSAISNSFTAIGNVPDDMPTSRYSSAVIDAVSDIYTAQSRSSLGAEADYCMSYRIVGTSPVPGLVIRDSSLSSIYQNFDETALKQALAGHYIVYRKTSSALYNLTTNYVKTLLGTNNIWADCGAVEVDYPADTKLYIQKVNKPTDDDMTADAPIASGKYFLVNNTLYLSTTTIPAGDTIIPGTNCTKTDLAAALNALNT